MENYRIEEDTIDLLDPMKDYDSLNGRFTVEFPCLGPYMITQVMK